MLSTLLNATRNFRTPVTILVESKLQAENGKLVLPIGSKDVMSLGHCVLFDGDGTEVISYDLPIAGRNIVDPDFIIGENRYVIHSFDHLIFVSLSGFSGRCTPSQ